MKQRQAANVLICSTEAYAALMQDYSILLRHSLRRPSCAQQQRLCKSTVQAFQHSKIPLQVVHITWWRRQYGVRYKHGWRYIVLPSSAKFTSVLSSINTTISIASKRHTSDIEEALNLTEASSAMSNEN